MSGRGLPGGGLVRRHKPDDIKVTLNLRTTISSSKISLSNTDSAVYIQIHCSIKHSTRPSLPVTLSTRRTPLERSLTSQNTSSPVWLNSALTYFRSTSDPDRYGGPPELGYRVHHRGSFARNLREDWDFITIPSLEDGKEVIVKHRVPVETLHFWRKREDGYRDEVKPEKEEFWTMGPSEGGLGTFWWRFGDLEGDLRDRGFKNDEWSDGETETRKENSVELVDSEGENGFGLTMDIENQAEVTFE